jgi:hypothetical protein
MQSRVVMFILIVGFWSLQAEAVDFLAQGRLYGGMVYTPMSEVNAEMRSSSLEEFSNPSMFGVEATYPWGNILDLGINYTKRYLVKEETNGSSTTDYHATLDQDTFLFVARLPLLRGEYVRMDGFAGIGGSNTTFILKTASQDGELSRRDTNNWFASITNRYGGSIGFGYKKVFLGIEAGYESNMVGSLKRSGNLSTGIQTIDLSGSYAAVTLIFDGLSARSK